MQIGKVNIKSKYSVIEWFRVCLGWRKSITLNLLPYSGKTTVDICRLANNGISLKKDDPSEITTAIEGNLYGYIDMIVTACKVPEEIKTEVATSIADAWTTEEISTAAQEVYNNLDFQSAFAVMQIMGQLRFEDDIEEKTVK
ncbi:hypothetical protein [Sphingobacterium multivorum]|uniref:hypothetical protein n=1 Tax=Sphingobacterium multivorum TaxID=28454 RepID=UPI003DA332D4